MPASSDTTTTERHRVRPRWVWSGLLLILVGLVVLALGLVGRSLVWSLVGPVVAAVGGFLTWRGGVMYDVHGSRPLRQEATELVHDDVHEGRSPTERMSHETAEQIARGNDERRRELLARVESDDFPSLAPVGVVVLLLMAVWLFVSQFVLAYPFTATGQSNALRDTGFAIVIGLCGLWMRQLGPRPVATGLCLLCGVLLVVFALTQSHAAGRTEWNEILTGAVVIGAAALTVSPGRGHAE